MTTDEAPDLLGKTLSGRYRIDAELGEGGMGAVYLATDLELSKRRVVLKFPHASNLDDPAFRLRFRDEIGSLARLDHPNIIKIHDAGEHEGLPYAVVQYAGGGDLRDRIDERDQTPEEVLGWLPGVADALDFVGRNGFCHRDVKPANIFFDEDGHAILSDFGIATVLDEAPTESDLELGNRTTVGMFVGSAKYCPPEALRRELSPAYDQYSLGVTVYQTLTGYAPHSGETSMDLLFAKNNDAPRDIRTVAPDLPEQSAAAIMRALAREPRDRFESCRAFAEAYAEGLRPEPASAPRPVAPWALAAGLTAAVVLGAAWLLRDRGPDAGAAAGGRAPGPTVLAELHQVGLGSTREEFRDAVALCKRADPRCNASWFASEDPVTTVLAPYALDLQEVSVGEFAEFVDRTGYVTGPEQRGFSHHQFVEVPGLTWRSPDPRRQGSDSRLPVVHVSYFDAEAFCADAGMRLPTQDEWEHAARGDERRVFPWGDDWDPGRAVWGAKQFDALEPVGERAQGAGPLGHLQMAGNVAEWTSTIAGGDRIIKGGSWAEPNPAQLRAAARAAESPEFASSDLGFRCAAEPGP